MAEVRSQGSSLCNQEMEVKYSDGATPLFLALEENEWRKALDIAEANPEQVRTWVRSTGTENTTFTWSMWRRLPIHEVSLAIFVAVTSAIVDLVSQCPLCPSGMSPSSSRMASLVFVFRLSRVGLPYNSIWRASSSSRC